jgi:hypothetical protein
MNRSLSFFIPDDGNGSSFRKAVSEKKKTQDSEYYPKLNPYLYIAKRQHQEHLHLVPKIFPNLGTQETNMYEDIKRLLKKVRYVYSQ